MALAECQHCGRSFEVPADFTGGLVPCPGCGKAAEVAGLRDPFWMALKVLSLLATVGAAVWIGSVSGPVAGIAVAIVVPAGIWLVSRAL